LWGDRPIKRIFLLGVMVISLAAVSYSLFSIFSQMRDYQKSSERYEAVKRIHHDSSISKEKERRKLLSINGDYVSWIKINGTKVDYPVVQGKDNDFYLTHNFFKQTDFVGTIFMDYRNSRGKFDKQIILYGHNMKDGSMFGYLKKYLEDEFYQSHRYISFDFQGSTYKGVIFSIYRTHNTSLLETNFQTEQDFINYVNSIKGKSVIFIPTEVWKNDTILTLSTCSKDSTERIIVHAKLMDRREQINED
jgi:sortase B